MKIIIQTPNVKARPNLLDLVNERMQKLSQHNDRLIEARVCLKVSKSDAQENKICEIKLVIPGNDLFTAKKARTFPEAVRRAAEAIERQLKDWKSTTKPYRKNNAIPLENEY